MRTTTSRFPSPKATNFLAQEPALHVRITVVLPLEEWRSLLEPPAMCFADDIAIVLRFLGTCFPQLLRRCTSRTSSFHPASTSVGLAADRGRLVRGLWGRAACKPPA